MKGIMCSTRKSDLEKTKLMQCETTVADWKARTKEVWPSSHAPPITIPLPHSHHPTPVIVGQAGGWLDCDL